MRACGLVWLLVGGLGLVQPAPLEAQTMDDAGALLAEGHRAEAIEVFQQVAASSPDSETAARARNNACVLLNQLGQYPAALEECLAALDLRRRLPNERALGRILNNTGLTRQNLGLLQPARESFVEALAINRRLEDLEGQVVNLNNLGISDTLAGRYATALANHAEAARLARGVSDEPWTTYQIHLARLNEGVVLERLGAYREALAAYRVLLLEAEREPAGPAGADDPRGRALVLVNVGVVYRNLGDPVTAVDYFRRAAARFEESGDRAGLANAWLNQGIAQHFDLRDLAAAEESYRRAMELATTAGDRSQEIEGLYYTGRLLLDRGRLDPAEEAFERCRAEAEAAAFAEGVWSGREGLARVARARGDLDLALERYRGTLEAIERQRGEILGADLRAGYFGSRRGVYGSAVAVLAELDLRDRGAGHAAEALELAQRVKNRELTEALGGDHRPTDRRPRLPPDEGGLVEFLAAEGRLFRWWADGSGIELVDLGPQRDILAAARAVEDELTAGRSPDREDLSALADRLFAGIDDLPEELWLAPDGALHRFPFELLEVAGRALVEDSTVRYLPSGALLGRLSGAAGEPALGWLGVGGEALPRGPALDRWVERLSLEPLPGAARELQRIAREAPTPHRLLREEEATEEGLRQALAGGTRVLHLASHAVVAPAGAAVLLHPTAAQDGLLEPREIAALDVPIHLTVLSSCRTSLAQSQETSALSTLTGAFLVGGSRSVIATLWDVDDAATAVFMEQYYHQLRRGVGVAEALRRTKLRLRRDARWSNPSLWAAYVLVGEGGAVVEAPRRWVVPAVVAGILLALVVFFVARRR